MFEKYIRHIVISVSGTNGAGKTGMSRFIRDALRDRGVEAELIESIPGDANISGTTGDEIIEELKDKTNPVEVVTMDVSGRRSPISEFKLLLATMDTKLSLEHGALFDQGDERTKNALRKNHLRDKCRAMGIPTSLAALIAPQLTGKRRLHDALE